MHFTFNTVSLCSSALILFCVLDVGKCLECYQCNVTLSSSSKEDPCKQQAKLQKCQDPAVCLTAKYSYNDQSLPVTTTTFQTCYPNLGGKECELFLQNIRNINPAKAKIEFSENCATCTENGCNQQSKENTTPSKPSAASTVSSFCLVSFICLCASKLL